MPDYLLLWKCASMATVAIKILIHCIQMEKTVSFGIELRQLFAATLSENRVAGVAIARLNLPFAIGSFVQAVVTSKTSRSILMVKIIRIRSPIRFHFRKEVRPVNPLHF